MVCSICLYHTVKGGATCPSCNFSWCRSCEIRFHNRAVRREKSRKCYVCESTRPAHPVPNSKGLPMEEVEERRGEPFFYKP